MHAHHDVFEDHDGAETSGSRKMTNKVISPDAWKKQIGLVEDGGEPPYDGGMEARISALEAANLETRDRLIKIETRLESVATKEDLANLRAELHSSLNNQTWRIIGA